MLDSRKALATVNVSCRAVASSENSERPVLIWLDVEAGGVYKRAYGEVHNKEKGKANRIG